MLLDLAKNKPGQIETDVLVVGAGIAGLILATRLTEKGHKVVVLESGGRRQDNATHPLNEVVLKGQAYRGAKYGRYRCLGGTSTRWGGAMLPFVPEDMSANWASANYSALMQYLPHAESLFGLPNDDYQAPEAPPLPDFTVRLAKWPPFKSRNVAILLKDKIETANGPIVWLNATVARFELDGAGRLTRAIAREPAGGQMSVTAKTTVIAAGAIESTRLLLLLDAHYDNRVFAPDNVLGRYFYDHLSVAIADMFPQHTVSFLKLFSFRFQGAVMRSLRYELNGCARCRESLPAAFLHIGIAEDERSAFSVLRDVFRKAQRSSPPTIAEIVRVMKGTAWLAGAVWWRYARGRLRPPTGAKFMLHQVLEQAPDPNNRISLCPDRTDIYGSPLAAIDWRVRPSDLQHFAKISSLFLNNWNASPLSLTARAVRRLQTECIAALVRCGGIYHPGGSARIGSSPSQGVVDGDLRVFRVPNLRVVSTAVFPNGGTANPTLMLILFALRCADQIDTDLKRF